MTNRSSAKIPTQVDLMWPTLCALKTRGGSASIRELDDQVSTDLQLEDSILDIPQGDGRRSKFEVRCAWARTRLRMVGAVDNSGSGVWTITELGQQLEREELLTRDSKRQRAYNHQQKRSREQRSAISNEADAAPVVESDEADEEYLRSELVKVLRELEPDAFERLCRLVLRRHGFERVEVTGGSGDGGIDGTGVLRVNLLSFHVNYQCKRYAGAVGPSAIRELRGTLTGSAVKGLFFTTGTFTEGAKREAVKDPARPIDLINGDKLCELLTEKGLGVKVMTVVDASFFDKFKKL